MKGIALFFLLIPLVVADFDCKISPWSLGLRCFYQYFSNVGNNYNCSTQFDGTGKTYLLSMEMQNIGADEIVTITGGDNTTASNTGASFSIQKYFDDKITVSITSGNNSTMTGIFFVCPVDGVQIQENIPIIKQNVFYGQEAFVLQQFTPTASSPVNFKTPRKWEIYTDSQVALIAATEGTNCPLDSCAQLIWIYDGIGEEARFIGTAADLQNKLYLTSNNTATLYFVTMDFGSDEMAVIANEAKNLEKCPTLDVMFYSNPSNDRTQVLDVGTTGKGACLTILNHCYNQDLCDKVILWAAVPNGDTGFYVYAGAPHPDPIQAGFVLQDYRNVSRYPFPQNFAGNARTFYTANDSVTLRFGDPGQVNNVPLLNRQGFVMTNFYPFNSSNMNGGSLALNSVDYSYNITLMIKSTYAPAGADAFFQFIKNGPAVLRQPFDTATNVGIPYTIHVEPKSTCSIFLWGGNVQNGGSLMTFYMEPGEITTTTVTTSTASTPSTSPGPTESTTVTDIPPTTMSTMTTTTVASTTMGTTVPTTTPKPASGAVFLMVTVFSMLLSLV